MTKRIGVIGTPGKWSTEALADAFAERTGYRQVIDMADVRLDLGTRTLMCGDLDLCDLDGLVLRVADLDLPWMLHDRRMTAPLKLHCGF